MCQRELVCFVSIVNCCNDLTAKNGAEVVSYVTISNLKICVAKEFFGILYRQDVLRSVGTFLRYPP
jgi:hypothetical protein